MQCNDVNVLVEFCYVFLGLILNTCYHLIEYNISYSSNALLEQETIRKQQWFGLGQYLPVQKKTGEDSLIDMKDSIDNEEEPMDMTKKILEINQKYPSTCAD